MDDLTSKLRRRVIARLVKDWIRKHPDDWDTLKQYNSFIKEGSKNEWREFEGDDVVMSHFAEIPKELMDDIDEIVGMETPFLDDYEERKWFSLMFPAFLVRKGKGAIPVQESGIKLRGQAK